MNPKKDNLNETLIAEIAGGVFFFGVFYIITRLAF